MKLVTAIIKPFKLDETLEALERIGIRSLTVIETRGYGQKAGTERYRGVQFAAQFLPMIKLEVAVAPHQVEQVVQAVHQAAKTGQRGDGKILVSGLDRVLSIRAGVTDETVPPLVA